MRPIYQFTFYLFNSLERYLFPSPEWCPVLNGSLLPSQMAYLHTCLRLMNGQLAKQQNGCRSTPHAKPIERCSGWRRCIIWSVYLNRYRSLLTINQPVCVANRWGECLTTIWILARQTLNRRKLNKGWWYKEGIPTASVILCSWGWMNEWMTVLIYCELCVVKLIVILQHNLIIILCPGWSWPRVRTDSLERSR